MLITALAAGLTRSLLASTLYLSAFSLLMAVIYLMMDAPDVAITEAAVGAGASTIFMLGALSLLPKENTPSPWPTRLLGLVAVSLLAGIFFYVALDMPSYGDIEAPAHQHVAPYYLQESGKEIGIPSVVASVLASYRGFDTLGETTVIFAASLCVVLLLGTQLLPRRNHRA